ncbi:MAG: type II toxin-antitoxin system RelE/ParE family toxin [Steroidobacteraceae bacterium]
MVEVRQTADFSAWLVALNNVAARTAILVRLARLAIGNPGDVRPVGEGVSELRVDVGPGYRAYYMQAGQFVLLMLTGGDKGTQAKDIRRALTMARELRSVAKAAAKSVSSRKSK